MVVDERGSLGKGDVQTCSSAWAGTAGACVAHVPCGGGAPAEHREVWACWRSVARSWKRSCAHPFCSAEPTASAA